MIIMTKSKVNINANYIHDKFKKRPAMPEDGK